MAEERIPEPEACHMLETVHQIQKRDCEVQPLAASAHMAVGSFTQDYTNYDRALRLGTTACSEAAKRAWPERIMHLPICIDEDGVPPRRPKRIGNRPTRPGEPSTCPGCRKTTSVSGSMDRRTPVRLAEDG